MGLAERGIKMVSYSVKTENKNTNYILVINPGSTSTKLAIFKEDENIISSKISHTVGELAPFAKVIDQREFRTRIVENFVEEKCKDIPYLSAVVGRGGILTPMESGTYKVSEEMKLYLSNLKVEHAANLGAIIADTIAQEWRVDAYIVDPVVVDEMDDFARITGIPGINRVSMFHALNHKASARLAAKRLNRPYEQCNLIVVHLGGGITAGAHKKGRVVDVNNGLNGDGPFALERAGSLPVWSLIEWINTHDYSMDALNKLITSGSGMVAHLGTNDLREINRMVKEGNTRAEFLFHAMAYNVAKEIGSLAPVLEGKIDAIVLTGGAAFDNDFVESITKRVQFLAPIIVIPGEDEMAALAQGVLRVLRNEETPKIWKY